MLITGAILMRKLLILFFLFILPFQHSTPEDKIELELILEVAEQEGLELESWEITMDTKLNRKMFEQFLTKIENNFDYTIIHEQDKIKYLFREKNPETIFDHTFHAIIPNQAENDITLKLVIKGQKWNEKTKIDYARLTKRLQFDYDVHFGRNFTCLKFHDDVIIRDGLIYENLRKKLQISHLYEYEDNVNNSTYVSEYYGYSKLFRSEITAKP